MSNINILLFIIILILVILLALVAANATKIANNSIANQFNNKKIKKWGGADINTIIAILTQSQGDNPGQIDNIDKDNIQAYISLIDIDRQHSDDEIANAYLEYYNNSKSDVGKSKDDVLDFVNVGKLYTLAELTDTYNFLKNPTDDIDERLSVDFLREFANYRFKEIRGDGACYYRSFWYGLLHSSYLQDNDQRSGIFINLYTQFTLDLGNDLINHVLAAQRIHITNQEMFDMLNNLHLNFPSSGNELNILFRDARFDLLGVFLIKIILAKQIILHKDDRTPGGLTFDSIIAAGYNDLDTYLTTIILEHYVCIVDCLEYGFVANVLGFTEHGLLYNSRRTFDTHSNIERAFNLINNDRESIGATPAFIGLKLNLRNKNNYLIRLESYIFDHLPNHNIKTLNGILSGIVRDFTTANRRDQDPSLDEIAKSQALLRLLPDDFSIIIHRDIVYKPIPSHGDITTYLVPAHYSALIHDSDLFYDENGTRQLVLPTKATALILPVDHIAYVLATVAPVALSAHVSAAVVPVAAKPYLPPPKSSSLLSYIVPVPRFPPLGYRNFKC